MSFTNDDDFMKEFMVGSMQELFSMMPMPPTVRNAALAKYKIPDISAEYRKAYPMDVTNRIGELKDYQFQFEKIFGEIAQGGQAFGDGDFDEDHLEERWDIFPSEVSAFKRRIKGAVPGDIIDVGPRGYGAADRVTSDRVIPNQMFRNTPAETYPFENGRTYVGFGYVDLSQLMWSNHVLHGDGVVDFYGYDQAEITVARSLLILEMLKSAEKKVSNKSILQVWFSSCWDKETKQEFAAFLQEVIAKSNNSLLKKHAKIWSKKAISVKDAEEKFEARRESSKFCPLFNLKSADDCVRYARYLFTGYLFMDVRGKDAVSGNVTMFPNASDNWTRVGETSFEDFFQSIGLTTMMSHLTKEDKSLIQFVQDVTKVKLQTFRSLIQSGAICCHLNVQEVQTKDDRFAEEVRRLNPARIDWSNIPDYMDRHDFQMFAKKCSGPKTVHTFHTMNWIQKVFGAQYLDYNGSRSLLEKMLKDYQKLKHKWLDPASGNHPQDETRELKRLARLDPPFKLPTNEFMERAAVKFGGNYAKYFLTTRDEKNLNMSLTLGNAVNPLFVQVDSTIFVAFSFTEGITLPSIEHFSLLPNTV